MFLSLKSRSSRLWLGIFIAAFILRLGYGLSQPAEFWDEDEGVYLTMAENFRAGEGLVYTPYRKAVFPPLYPLFLAGFLWAGFPLFTAARVGRGSGSPLAGNSFFYSAFASASSSTLP